ncbi:exonuclease domain-containing protein [Costertonia aggregata]|uniref:Excinuclease cho n=1 Tax=Costertonia aggregata TaxID=343403 RepID=A0A7H9AT06_9FLAO|nr:exonuclease domain-containing protein [Costertonia aggregata]QLG46566.1 GIY-YIG nuclease family protein [Costertonia aggregata]
MERQRTFAVVNLKTTGKSIRNNRITEIAIVRIEDGAIAEKFVSLVNPEQHIPEYMTKLNGIDDEMVLDRPNFAEIAEKVDLLTHNAIVVAHDVSFVYYVLRSEFRYLGYNYERPKLCTVRLAKRLIPNLLSYKLENLCGTQGIPLIDRRAEAATNATVVLFQRLLLLDDDFKVIDMALKTNKPKIKLPTHIGNGQFEKLPENPGVYKFQGSDGEIIYIGKAKNIKKRVLSHFQSNLPKEVELCSQTFSIDFELSGSELVALLLESDLIKKHTPEYNSVQKKNYIAYHIKSYRNKKGILQLTVEECPAIYEPTELFFTKGAAKKKLEVLCEKFSLCPKFTGLQRKKGKCNHVKFPNCAGVCNSEEEIGNYNKRAQSAFASLKANTDSYLIQNKGRKLGEASFVVVLDGVYQGFGFADISQQICSIDEMVDLITPRKQTYHTMQILNAYRKNHPSRILNLKMANYR